MQKITLLFIGILFALPFAFAQKEQKIGIKAGFNYSTIVGDVSDQNNNGTPGYHLGLYISNKLSDSFTIQPEMLFSLQGTQIRGDKNSLHQNNFYFNVPIMLKYFDSDLSKLNFQAGPQIGMLLRSKLKGDRGNEEVNENTLNKFKEIDISMGMGIGYDKENINFSLRYFLGLSNILEKEITRNNVEVKENNSSVQLSVGYTF